MNVITGLYILGRELRLIPFNTGAAWAAVALGAVWLAGAALQKAMDQSERVRQASTREKGGTHQSADATQANNEREP